MKRHVIFDFDGTLLLKVNDVEEVNRVAICTLRAAIEAGIQPMIITGRPCEEARKILKTLQEENVDINRRNVICRETPLPEVDWKREAFIDFIRHLNSQGGEVLEYHDNNADVLSAISRIREKVCLILYIDGIPTIFKRTENCISDKMWNACEKERYGI